MRTEEKAVAVDEELLVQEFKKTGIEPCWGTAQDLTFKDLYIDEAKKYVKYLSENGLGAVDDKKLEAWKDNFDGITGGEYICMRILCNLICYSRSDIRGLIRYNVMRLIQDFILKEQIKNRFCLREHNIEKYARDVLSKMIFIPLAVDNDPCGSSNSMGRMMTQEITGLSVKNLNEAIKSIEKKEVTDIIVFDDCIGSGEQLGKFRSKRLEPTSSTTLEDYCKNNGTNICYFYLIGYKKAIEEIRSQGIKVYCAELIDDTHRLFHNSSECWRKEPGYSSGEVDFIKMIIDDYMKDSGTSYEGFMKFDFTVIIDDFVPNWTTPLIHKEGGNWKYLIRERSKKE